MDSNKRRKRQVFRVTGAAAAAALLGLPGAMVQAASVESRTVNPAAFDSVSVDVPATFSIRIGPATEVRLSAESKVLKVIDVTSKNGQLTITTNGSFSTQQGVQVDITTPSLKSVTANGASEVTIGALRAARLQVTVLGSSTVEMEKLNLQHFSAHIRESSEIRAAGSVTSQQIEIDGSASYDGQQLKSVSAILKVADAGSAQVQVKKDLDVKISDAGSVTYAGRPTITKSVSDAGSLDAQ